MPAARGWDWGGEPEQSCQPPFFCEQRLFCQSGRLPLTSLPATQGGCQKMDEWGQDSQIQGGEGTPQVQGRHPPLLF